MASKAERKRRKRQARKMHHTASPGSGVVYYSPPPVPAQASRDDVAPKKQLASGRMSEKQELAWRWFSGLRRDVDAGGTAKEVARKQLEAVRPHLTTNEYAVLCELSGPRVFSAAHRIGRSWQSVLELEMSALRKLVVYMAMGGDEHPVRAAG